MDEVIFIVAPFLIFGVFLFVTNHFEKKKSDKPLSTASFAARKERVLAEVQARKSAEQVYTERIEAAFNEARECGALIITESDYDDIECDMHRSRERHPGDLPKPLLTRITPILTPELAEKVRDYEIVNEHFPFQAEKCAEVCLAARMIKWRVEEVPEHYAPPTLKDRDRILYPDLSGTFALPEGVAEEARKMLGYDDEYVKQQAQLLEEKEGSFEVTEE